MAAKRGISINRLILEIFDFVIDREAKKGAYETNTDRNQDK